MSIDLAECGCWDDGDVIYACRVHWFEGLENQRGGCEECRVSRLKSLWTKGY